ncbi:hypothetical protein [Denitratisoma sp. DHT3]|uniref:hypothetical protein n=1 Tax=Denitratisoma sp. DHT3 TaxID=1981880 RepID=UPI00119E63B5|nr:hypothetical protein [Denitratisoma sp. DHT3]
MRRLLLILALTAVSAAAETGPAESTEPTDSTESTVFRLDDTRLLKPARNGTWDLVDASSGKTQTLRLPAFHEAFSAATLHGDKLAYTSLIRRGERLQLGCISIDLIRGKVIDREDTSLLLAENGDRSLQAPSFSGDGQRVACHLSGEKCDGSGAAGCTPVEETVTLSSLLSGSARLPHKPVRGKSAHKPAKKTGTKALPRRVPSKSIKKVRRK